MFSTHTLQLKLICAVVWVLFFVGPSSAQFQHRVINGWITDFASEGRPNDTWPSIRIDDKLLKDYDQCFAAMQEVGLNEMSVWGLFVSREWPLELEKTIDETRRQQVLSIIRKAHDHHVKILSGLGVYNWGFDAIIRAHPDLACEGNLSSMCLHKPESWEWQKKVIDYIFSFPLDGVSMQSADQGRCACGESKSMSDIEYHAAINQKVVQYIRKTYPNKIIGINTWGMTIKENDLPDVKTLTKDVDYFVDVRVDGKGAPDPAFLVNLIHSIKPCSYGTIGTPNIEPPQHWSRDRWFLPTGKRSSQAIQLLYKQGGRVVENFMHIWANPGDEATLRLQGVIEQNPSADWAESYKNVLSGMFSPVEKSAQSELFDLFVGAEDAYFENLTRYDPADLVRLEPLVSDKTGEPIYIKGNMDKNRQQQYLKETQRLLLLANGLETKVQNKTLLNLVKTCLQNTRKDIVYCLGK